MRIQIPVKLCQCGLIFGLFAAGQTRLAPDVVTSLPGGATAISVGANGSLYIVGNSSGDSNGFPPFKWNGTGFDQIAGSGTREAVDPNGTLWLLNKNGGLFHYASPTSQSSSQVSSDASDVAVGADGSVYIVGNSLGDSNGFPPYKFNGSSFVRIAGSGFRVAVDSSSRLWLLNKNGGIFRYESATSQTSDQIPGTATAISASADGAVYIVGTTPCDANGCQVYKFNGTGFDAVSGITAVEIAADQNGAFWAVTKTGAIERFTSSALTLTCNPATGPTMVGVSYSTTCTAAGGSPPYAFGLNPANVLPAGLNFVQSSANSVTISGTPTTAGSFSFGVFPQDQTGQHLELTATFSGTIAPASCTYTFGSPTFAPPGPVTVNPAGGSASILLNTQAGCPWTATSSVPWAPVDSGSMSGTGTSQVVFDFQANNTGQTRTGSVVIAGITLTFTQAPINACSFTFGSPTFAPPGPVTVNPAGGAASILLNTQSGCAWTATSSVPWAPVDPGSVSGTGTAQVLFDFQANNTGQTRTGSVVIAGITLTITQAPITSTTCTFSFGSPVFAPPGPIIVPAAGGQASILLNTQSGCAWTATSSTPWAPVDPASVSGTGTAQVLFDFQANNTGQTRTGSVVIAGITLTVTQAPINACSFTFGSPTFAPPGPVTVNPAGGPASILLNTQSGCAWTATSSVPWAPVDPGSVSGTGTAQVLFDFQANNTGQTRTGSVIIAGITLTITQAPIPTATCTFTFGSPTFAPPGPVTVSPAGGQASILLNTQSGCAWTATSSTSWAPVDPGSVSGTGTAQVLFDFQANNTGQTRTGSVIIAGITLTITQAPAGAPAWSITSSHSGTFTEGQNGIYTITATNIGTAPTFGGIAQVFDTLPAGLTAVSIQGSGWICAASSMIGCNRGDSLAAGASYPSITLTVSVASNASSSVVNQVSISGGGATASANGSDPTIILSSVPTNCTYSVNPPSDSRQISGGSGSFSVSTQAGCPASVVVEDPWIHLSSPTNLMGGGTVSYSVDSNASPAGRATIIGVADSTGKIQARYPITQSGGVPNLTGLTFVSMPPCRVMETRNQFDVGQSGSFGPPSLKAGETRSLIMTQSSVCSIPSAAKAYVVNVTVIPVTPGNNAVTIYPADEEQPRAITASAADGNITANGAIILGAAANGAISVNASNAMDVLIDIAGYFTDNRSISNLVFYPLTPCRVVDTRAAFRAPGPFGSPSIQAGTIRQYRFPASPDCQIPGGAAAYSMTITAAPQGALQYLTAWPAGVPQPNASIINSFDGRIIPNSVIVPASSDGTIQIFAANTTDFFIDINGYFAPDDGRTGLSYFPITQCIASDSSDQLYPSPYGQPSYSFGSRSIAVPGSPFCASIPSTANGYAVNVTANPYGSNLAYVTLYPTGAAQPNASMLNDFQGKVVTNSAIVPAGANGSIDIYANGAADLQLLIGGYFSR